MKNLNDWLSHITHCHPLSMDFDFTRIKIVYEQLKLQKLSCPAITVTGTNGKGSSVACLEAIYLAAGYEVGSYTSPHLFTFNERIRLNGQSVDDDFLCDAFSVIEKTRGSITLSYFEFSTLAAFWIFHQHPRDILILEVGLGGRLDAVNIIDADIAVITSIDFDHMEYLGNTRESIAKEKAGIMRERCPVVCGDTHPPNILLEESQRLSAPFYCLGRDFHYEISGQSWHFLSKEKNFLNLPFPKLLINNVVSCLMVVQLLQERLPAQRTAIEEGIHKAQLPGRCQKIELSVPHLFDVSHNPASIKVLAQELEKISEKHRCLAVWSMLSDKDIVKSVEIIHHQIAKWFIAPLAEERAASIQQLENALLANKVSHYEVHLTPQEAYQNALYQATGNDIIIVFGSFYWVGKIFQCLNLVA